MPLCSNLFYFKRRFHCVCLHCTATTLDHNSLSEKKNCNQKESWTKSVLYQPTNFPFKFMPYWIARRTHKKASQNAITNMILMKGPSNKKCIEKLLGTTGKDVLLWDAFLYIHTPSFFGENGFSDKRQAVESIWT